ncbi:hypothetical protein P5V15_005538 [Pogonomyrmex californicus]
MHRYSAIINHALLYTLDMDLIEVLWKQDVDLGFTLVEPATKKPSTSEKEAADDELEKLKTLEAINATYQKGMFMCFFTGEFILSSSSQSGSGSSIVDEDDPLLNEASLALDNHPLAGLTDDSLGLNDTLALEHDFTSELLEGDLLGSAGVDGLLSNDTLGLPDEFNLEEALQLVGLDEAQPEETKSEVKKKKKKEDTAEESASAKGDADITVSSNVEVAKSSRCEDPETGDMIHTPQFHHPHHPHHRSFQMAAVNAASKYSSRYASRIAVLRDAERCTDVVTENSHGICDFSTFPLMRGSKWRDDTAQGSR